MSHVWQDVGRDEFCCVIIEFLLNFCLIVIKEEKIL